MSGKTERREDLGNGIFVTVNSLFSFGTDALLLAEFAQECAPRAKRAVDLGTGCGVIPLLWAKKSFPVEMDALELQPEGAALACRSVEENGLSHRIRVQCADLRLPVLPAGVFDLVACNPPYFPSGAGGISPVPERNHARAEDQLALTELCTATARLLKNGGKFCLCHRTERMASVMYALCSAGLTPKKLQMVRTSPLREPKLFLLCAVRGGGEGLAILPEKTTWRKENAGNIDGSRNTDW